MAANEKRKPVGTKEKNSPGDPMKNFWNHTADLRSAPAFSPRSIRRFAVFENYFSFQCAEICAFFGLGYVAAEQMETLRRTENYDNTRSQ
jgi:hypothetical protein